MFFFIIIPSTGFGGLGQNRCDYMATADQLPPSAPRHPEGHPNFPLVQQCSSRPPWGHPDADYRCADVCSVQFAVPCEKDVSTLVRWQNEIHIHSLTGFIQIAKLSNHQTNPVCANIFANPHTQKTSVTTGS